MDVSEVADALVNNDFFTDNGVNFTRFVNNEEHNAEIEGSMVYLDRYNAAGVQISHKEFNIVRESRQFLQAIAS